MTVHLRKLATASVLALLVLVPVIARGAEVDGAPPATPAQTVERADKALADTGLSAHDRARLLVSRGLARETLGQRDDALADFTMAISAGALGREEQARALYDRGVTLDELNRTDDAIGDYTGALRVEPKFSAALNNRGNGYRREGRLAEARRDYEASIAAGNEHPEYPDYGMGQIAETLAQPSAARDYYRAALAANPQFALATERLAALGAGPTAGASDPPVLLRPPGHRETVAPAPDASDGAVHLRPPPRRERLAAPHAVPPNRGATGPGLKPAINDAGAGAAQAVQLGAWRSQAEVNEAWPVLQRQAAGALAAFTPVLVAVDLPGKGHFYRLRIILDAGVSAAALCSTLKAKGLACLVVPASG